MKRLKAFYEYLHAADSGCILWTGAMHYKGYGLYGAEYAHRVSYQICMGPIPNGMQIDHLCHNRACVNPYHMRVCTLRQNHLNSLMHSRNTNGFKGIVKNHNRWMARIQINGKQTYLGTFDTKEQAHEAYRNASIFFHGDYAQWRSE